MVSALCATNLDSRKTLLLTNLVTFCLPACNNLTILQEFLRNRCQVKNSSSSIGRALGLSSCRLCVLAPAGKAFSEVWKVPNTGELLLQGSLGKVFNCNCFRGQPDSCPCMSVWSLILLICSWSPRRRVTKDYKNTNNSYNIARSGNQEVGLKRKKMLMLMSWLMGV